MEKNKANIRGLFYISVTLAILIFLTEILQASPSVSHHNSTVNPLTKNQASCTFAEEQMGYIQHHVGIQCK